MEKLPTLTMEKLNKIIDDIIMSNLTLIRSKRKNGVIGKLVQQVMKKTKGCAE